MSKTLIEWANERELSFNDLNEMADQEDDFTNKRQVPNNLTDWVAKYFNPTIIQSNVEKQSNLEKIRETQLISQQKLIGGNIEKESNFVLLEIKSLKEIVAEFPEAHFDLYGDLYSSKINAINWKDNQIYENRLPSAQLSNLGETIKVWISELKHWPQWIIKRNLGR